MPYADQLLVLKENHFRSLLREAFHEDHSEDDITTLSIFRDNSMAKARIFTREKAVLAGISVARAAFREIDPSVILHSFKEDGDEILAGDTVLEIEGPIQSLLKSERVALNFLALLSGTATAARSAAEKLKEFGIRPLDTRKTIPGYRYLQKYAVAMGGAWNHRMHLSDLGLIKDNHIAHVGSVSRAISLFREKYPTNPLEVEVETLAQLNEALAHTIDMVLLDNMDPHTMRECTAIIRAHNERTGNTVTSEASGGFLMDNLDTLRDTGVDFVSMGSLTSRILPIDFSMEILG